MSSAAAASPSTRPADKTTSPSATRPSSRPLEFTGGREFRCTSELGGTDNPPGSGPNTDWIPCDMTGGSSGGGWVAGGSVLSVNSYSYCLLLGLRAEPLRALSGGQGREKLYSSVAGEAQFCAGKQVTVLGTSGPDELVGTAAATYSRTRRS